MSNIHTFFLQNYSLKDEIHISTSFLYKTAIFIIKIPLKFWFLLQYEFEGK